MAFTRATARSGNGVIAAFVAGLAFGSGNFARNRTDDDMQDLEDAEHVAEFTEDAAELLGAVTFFVFGNLFVGDALGDFSPSGFIAAIASLTVVRIVPVFIAPFLSGCDPWRSCSSADSGHADSLQSSSQSCCWKNSRSARNKPTSLWASSHSRSRSSYTEQPLP